MSPRWRWHTHLRKSPSTLRTRRACPARDTDGPARMGHSAHRRAPGRALRQMRRLNASLAERSAAHLDALVAHRTAEGRADAERGSCAFNLTLINAMDPAAARPDLKPEPTFEATAVPCSVSWHADSSLEHFSTIAVYHSTDAPPSQPPDWRIALRVCHVRLSASTERASARVA